MKTVLHEIDSMSIQAIRRNMDKLVTQESMNTSWIETFKENHNITELSGTILIEFIDKVFIYEDKRIEISVTYGDSYKALETVVQS